MIWIIGLTFGVLLAIVTYIVSVFTDTNVYDTFVGWIIATGIFIASAGFLGVIFTITDIKDCSLNYETTILEKRNIEERGKIVSIENEELKERYIKDVQRFNKKLLIEQNTIKYWGNTWTFHDRRYLTLEPIEINEEIYLNIPAEKVIIEQE